MYPPQFGAFLNETVIALPSKTAFEKYHRSVIRKMNGNAHTRKGGPEASEWNLQLFKPAKVELPALPKSNFQPPPRMNLPLRLTVSLESSDLAWHNEQRATSIRRYNHDRNYVTWMPFFYGNSEQVESHKKEIREVLKTQMEDRQRRKREAFTASFEESLRAREQDRKDVDGTLEQIKSHKQLSLQYSRDNKALLELRQQRQREIREKEMQQEKKLLSQKSFNWQESLK